jgi:hypothetical protein
VEHLDAFKRPSKLCVDQYILAESYLIMNEKSKADGQRRLIMNVPFDNNIKIESRKCFEPIASRKVQNRT